jgi:ATP-grasp domain
MRNSRLARARPNVDVGRSLRSPPSQEERLTLKVSAGTMKTKVLVLVDPVTEWKEVVNAAKALTYKDDDDDSPLPVNPLIVAVQFSPIPQKLKPFLPSKENILRSGVDHVVTMHHRDVCACVRDIQVFLNNTNADERQNVLGVIPLSEMAVDVSDLLAACLGVHHHNPLDRLTSRRDKGIMKDVVAAAGLRVAQHTRLSSVKELHAALGDSSIYSFPVVVKTPQGFSTSDVFICSTLIEAEEAVTIICGTKDDDNARLGPDGRPVHQALLEEYVDGTEFAVNLMVLNHTLCVTDVWRYQKDSRARYQSADICNPHDPALAEVVMYATNVAQAVGVEYGAAHVELKATKNNVGIYHRPVMIEVGARLSGGRKGSIAKAVVRQWDPFRSLILSHCGLLCDPYPTNFAPHIFARHLFLPIDKSGTIRRIHVETSQYSSVECCAMMVKVGDVVEKTSDIVSCAGFVWLMGEESCVQNDTEQIRTTFEIQMDE